LNSKLEMMKRMIGAFLLLSLVGFNIDCNQDDRSEKIIRDFLFNVYNSDYEEADRMVCEKNWSNSYEYLDNLRKILIKRFH